MVNHSAEINDIDRVMKVLDEKKHTSNELRGLIDSAFINGEPYEDDYYIATGFKAGTLHLIFKRYDLLEKINAIIAEHYGDRTLAG